MGKFNWSETRSYFRANKSLIALSAGVGGIASIVALYAFKITFLNEIAYDHILSLLTAGSTIDDFLFTDGVKWVMLVSIISLLLMPLLYNSKNQIVVFILTFFIALDSMLALFMFINQTIGNLGLIFISISFVYYVFAFILLLKSVYRWLHDADRKVDVVKLTFLWTVIIALFGLIK